MKNTFLILSLLIISLFAMGQENNKEKPKVPYSPARLTASGMLYISGQIPISPDTGKLLKGDISEETRIVMERMGKILADHGMDFPDLVKCTVFLTDMRDYRVVNQVYASFFKEVFPAREAIEVSNLPLGAAIEISGIASR